MAMVILVMAQVTMRMLVLVIVLLIMPSGTQIRVLEVATLAPVSRPQSGGGRVTRIRPLTVATLAPFGRPDSGCAAAQEARYLDIHESLSVSKRKWEVSGLARPLYSGLANW